MLITLALLATVTAPPLMTPGEAAAAERQDHWYGAPALVFDAASIGLFMGGVVSGNDGVATVGIVGISAGLAAGPMVHALNHHPARAAASFGLRLATAGLAVAMIAVVLEQEQCATEHADTTCKDVDTALLVAAGSLGVVMAADDFVLMRDAGAPPPPAARPVVLAPAIRPVRSGAVLSLAARF